jgi:phage baseplate assembly protein W
VNDDTTGFSFPFRIDPATGGVAKTSGSDKLKENLKHLILTGIGERVMRRDYGGGVWQVVGDPNNDALRAIVQHQIAKTITRFEPRALLQEVVVTEDNVGAGTLWVKIRYIDKKRQNTEHLSVQFGLGAI